MSSKGLVDPTEALGTSEELPHHVKVVPQSGEFLTALRFYMYHRRFYINIHTSILQTYHLNDYTMEQQFLLKVNKNVK